MNTVRIDEFGPEYVIEVSDSTIGLEGFLVIDNTNLGPGKGGIRMTDNVTTDEVFRLARTMTWKNAIAGIPFGGAKAGLIMKTKDPIEKQKLVEAFARKIKPFIPELYIAGPDVNSGEKEMMQFAEAIGNPKAATGKPADYCYGENNKECGLPHELGSTGFGVVQSTKVTLSLLQKDITKTRFAIEGFGNVGSFAFKFLKELDAKIVAVSDSRGTAVKEDGFEEDTLTKLKADGKSVVDYPGAQKLPAKDIYGLDVDVLILATVTDVINESNKNQIKAKMIVEGSNIPMSEAIENELFEKGIVIIPDMVANAGGVISSYAEYMGYSAEKMFELVEEKIVHSTTEVMQESLQKKANARIIAMELAKKIVKQERSKSNEHL